MDHAIDAIIEIFTWVGLGAGLLVGLLALVLRLVDGTWVPVRAVIERGGTRILARWFDEDGGVNEARLTHEQQHALAGKDMADVYSRRGDRNRMRLTHGSPAVRAAALLAAGLFGLGVCALILSWILLFARG